MAYSKEETGRNKTILVATLNYLLEYHIQDIVFDDYSPSKEFYLHEQKRTELDIQKSQSKQIEKRLNMHISLLRHRFDLGFNDYIKKTIGYDIDIFEKYKADVLPIIGKGTIDHNDVNLVENYLKAYSEVYEEQENVAALKKMLTKYENDLAELRKSAGPVEVIYGIISGNKTWQGNEAEYKEKLKERYKDWLLAEEVSPNGIDKLNVQFSGKGEHALTYVVILLANGSGNVYCAKGEKLPIKAYWKDKNTVVVETKKAYDYLQKYHQVTSYDEVFKVEYTEV